MLMVNFSKIVFFMMLKIFKGTKAGKLLLCVLYSGSTVQVLLTMIVFWFDDDRDNY